MLAMDAKLLFAVVSVLCAVTAALPNFAQELASVSGYRSCQSQYVYHVTVGSSSYSLHGCESCKDIFIHVYIPVLYICFLISCE